MKKAVRAGTKAVTFAATTAAGVATSVKLAASKAMVSILPESVVPMPE